MALTPLVIMDSVSSTGISGTFDIEKDWGGDSKKLINNIAVQLTLGSTDPATDLTFIAEGSIDNENWFILAHHVMTELEIRNTAAMFYIANKPTGYIRGNLTHISGGTNPTVTVKVVGV